MEFFYAFEWGDHTQDSATAPVDGAVYVFATEKDREEWCTKAPDRKAMSANDARRFIGGSDEAYQEWLEDIRTGFRAMAKLALDNYHDKEVVEKVKEMHQHFFQGVGV